MKGSLEHSVEKNVSRRRLLKVGTASVLSCVFPKPVLAVGRSFFPAKRELYLFNTHTGESLRTVYQYKGKYLAHSLSYINRIMRDHRTGEEISINTRLLDFLYTISTTLGTDGPFHIVSAYRTPESNRLLRQTSSAVAKKSMHMYGKAIDVRLPNVDLDLLKRVALQIRRGGVGYYPSSNFIHLDVGPPRSW